MTLTELLSKTMEMGGSDLHLTTATPPQVRVHGHLVRLDAPDLTPSETKSLAYSVLTDSQKKRFEEAMELDFSFGVRGIARFRCNMFSQKGAVGAVYRLIPEQIRSFEELGLPAVVATLAERRRQGVPAQRFGTPQEFGAFIASEAQKWASVARTAGIQPE